MKPHPTTHTDWCARGVSLALVRNKRPVLGVVELPFLGVRYSAIQGEGAYRNGAPIQPSRIDRLHDAVVSVGDYAVGDSADSRNVPRLAIARDLAGQALRVRMFGSAAIDLVWGAEGKVDASIALSNKPWDMAAGVAIAREAGAQVVDSDGSDHSFDSKATIAASPCLINEVLALVGRAASSAQVTSAV
jgi:myo-inositol-1(or 4)-monophosphatase